MKSQCRELNSRPFPYQVSDCFYYHPPVGAGGADCACACFGLSIIKVHNAVKAWYFAIITTVISNRNCDF